MIKKNKATLPILMPMNMSNESVRKPVCILYTYSTHPAVPACSRASMKARNHPGSSDFISILKNDSVAAERFSADLSIFRMVVMSGMQWKMSRGLTVC